MSDKKAKNALPPPAAPPAAPPKPIEIRFVGQLEQAFCDGSKVRRGQTKVFEASVARELLASKHWQEAAKPWPDPDRTAPAKTKAEEAK